MQELILLEPSSTDLVDPSKLYVQPTPAQHAMGMLEPRAETLARVIQHTPMRGFPRQQKKMPKNFDAISASRAILERHFAPFLDAIDKYGTCSAETPDDDLAKLLDPVLKAHQELGIVRKVAALKEQHRTFIKTRRAFAGLCEEELMKPDTFIQMEYLPDIFMAVPVWYFFGNTSFTPERRGGIQLHPHLMYFCDLVRGQRWADTFLIFNYGVRSFEEYDGDNIPPRTLQRLRHFSNIFDYLVMMTPYLDQAGQYWDALEALPQRDPYVIGFIKGFSYMFVVDRFSDSGIFPALCEMVANTIDFLGKNQKKLAGFDKLSWGSPWFATSAQGQGRAVNIADKPMGQHLQNHTKRLLTVFNEDSEQNLFDWLKGRPAPAAA